MTPIKFYFQNSESIFRSTLIFFGFNRLMRLMILEKPKKLLRLVEIPTPKPGTREILIRVLACALCRIGKARPEL